MENDIVLREDRGPIAIVTLNDPGRLNALSDAMISALQSVFVAVSQDSAIRCVILRANGRAFCPGHDLKEMSAARAAGDGGRAAFADLFKRCADLMLTIRKLPQPVVAQVHNIATAAGCQLVATCDMAIAAEGTRFGVNGVNIGLFCSTPMVALTRNIGRKRAFEMLTTGEFMDAEEAVAVGLINRVVPAEELEAQTLSLAETLADKLGPALRLGKRVFYEQADMLIEDAYTHAGAAMVENMMRDDTASGIAAFMEKRKPVWDQ